MIFLYLVFFFFFSSRRRHTRFKCDWSSDVCSSDLVVLGIVVLHQKPRPVQPEVVRVTRLDRAAPGEVDGAEARLPDARALRLGEIDRKSVVEGKRVDLGGRRIIKKKKERRSRWRES